MLVRRWAEFSTAIRGSSWSTDTWTGVLRRDEVRLIISDSRPCGRPPFECCALRRQGGGARGAYQGGVYEDLAEAGLHPAEPPDFNPRQQRRPACRQSARGVTREFSAFWELVAFALSSMAVSPLNVAPRGPRRCAPRPLTPRTTSQRLRALVAELLEVKEPIVKKRRHPHAGRDLATARKAARSSQCLPCQEGATPRHVSERRTADRRRTRALGLPEEARVVDAVRARSTR